jgi:hypothetical protein
MRKQIVIGALAAGAAMAAGWVQDARACGGCFIRPSSQNGTVVTDHRMIFSVSTTQTTLYDQIEYSGNPSDFAWVLPIKSQVTLGVSSDLLFQTLDNLTAVDILAPPNPCPIPAFAFGGAGGSSSGGGSSGASGSSSGVTVITMQVVGPYQTVQLHPNTTSDTAALTTWLASNSYNVPASIAPVIAAYVNEGFDFLAVKLVPGAGVSSMRPLAITTPGAGLTLPLRMVAAGTGSTVGITLWVVGQGRYEPENFPTFTIAPSSIVWDFSIASSDYATIRSQKETQLHNAAFQVESSLDISPYTVESTVLSDPNASAYVSVPDADGGAGLSPIEARSQDMQTLFPNGGSSVRITRMRGDLSQAALANDLVLQAASDQSTLSNVYQSVLFTGASCSFGNGAAGSSGGSGGIGSNGTTCVGNVCGPANVVDTYEGGVGSASDDGGTNAASSKLVGGGGCSASSSRPDGVAGMVALLAGLAGAFAGRSRSRKPR